MKVIITESQYNTLILEYYNPDKVYTHKWVMDQLKGCPGYLWKHAKGLPRFYYKDENGVPYVDENNEKIILTRIPEVIYNYIYGNF